MSSSLYDDDVDQGAFGQNNKNNNNNGSRISSSTTSRPFSAIDVSNHHQDLNDNDHDENQNETPTNDHYQKEKCKNESKNKNTSSRHQHQRDEDLRFVLKTIPEIFRFAPPIVSEFVSYQISELLLLFNDDEENDDVNADNGILNLHLSPKVKLWLKTSLANHLLDLVDGSFQAIKLSSGKSTNIDEEMIEKFEQKIDDDEKKDSDGNAAADDAVSAALTKRILDDNVKVQPFSRDRTVHLHLHSAISAFNSLGDFYARFENMMEYFATELLFGEVFEKLIALEYEEMFLSALEDEEIERRRILNQPIDDDASDDHKNNHHHEREQSFLKRREEITMEASKILATGQLVVFCFVAFGKDLFDKIISSMDEASHLSGNSSSVLKVLRDRYDSVIDASSIEQSEKEQQNQNQQNSTLSSLSSKYRWVYDNNAKRVVSTVLSLASSMSSLKSLEQRTKTKSSSSTSNNNNNNNTNSSSSPTTTSSKEKKICAFCQYQKDVVSKFYATSKITTT